MNYQKIIAVIQTDLDLGSYLVLELMRNNNSYQGDNYSINAFMKTLLIKGYVSQNKITDKGLDLLHSVDVIIGEAIPKVPSLKKSKDKFDEWWSVYPATNNFEYKGMKFTGAQTKRIKKEDCKKLFNKLVVLGLDADDIINATKYHIERVKELSYKDFKKANGLTFVANSERYLREKLFEPYIEMAKKPITETLTNTFEI